MESASIMVTLDKDMLEIPALFKELLKSGMTIARINLARDYSVWKSLVECIRTAEKELGLEKQNMKCKIYMDLPGPKIRVSDFKKTIPPLNINTEKSAPIGYLMSRKSEDSLISNNFKIKINIEEFTDVTTGQIIPIIDSKGRKRYFTVLERISVTCLKVELNKSAILNEDTVLELGHNYKCKITNAK
ncbi:pyruvate kinase [Oceanobacillus sp. AG]|uniref:pyruvate kinase n=1 Tax=Oceanobacillus sp. AG TaxID=2681969 RepID=UPI0012EC6F80|nr:pyruvate kinase [Oceanobacillus sp. AG]